MVVLLYVTKNDMSTSCSSLVTHPVHILLDCEENKRETPSFPNWLSLSNCFENPQFYRYADDMQHIQYSVK